MKKLLIGFLLVFAVNCVYADRSISSWADLSYWYQTSPTDVFNINADITFGGTLTDNPSWESITIKGWNGSASVARTLSGNNAYDGFIFDNKDTVNFQNISFTMFKNTTGSGSVIWSNSTKINISGNVTFSNNTSYLNGGAIYAKNASQITIIASDNLVFSGNMANGENNDIYLDNSDLILNVSNGKSLVLNGGIKGSG